MRVSCEEVGVGSSKAAATAVSCTFACLVREGCGQHKEHLHKSLAGDPEIIEKTSELFDCCVVPLTRLFLILARLDGLVELESQSSLEQEASQARSRCVCAATERVLHAGCAANCTQPGAV